jgi:Bacterial PH domain
MKHYAAPWGKLLVGTSLVATLICVGVSIFILIVGPSDPDFTGPTRWVVLLPVVIVAISALFMVRGYAVTADEILIQRPLWSTRFERARLQSASIDHDATRGSIRLFGNGGLFSFTGIFRSPKLGRYRAFVTDPSRTVVLQFAERVVVISPADPEAFVRDVTPRR